jgi:hypothetical protein
LGALIGAMGGVCFGTFAGLERGGQEIERHPR